MKYLSEYRDPDLALKLLEEIKSTVTKPWKIMEVCGGQTHTIVKYGIDDLLPETMELLHGPGCPRRVVKNGDTCGTVSCRHQGGEGGAAPDPEAVKAPVSAGHCLCRHVFFVGCGGVHVGGACLYCPAEGGFLPGIAADADIHFKRSGGG